MKKKSKIEKVSHAFRVSFHQWDEVKVERFKVTASTKTTVTYINDYGIEFKLEKIGAAYRWFKSKDRANDFARAKLKERIDFYQKTIDRLEQQIQKIK